MQSLFEIFSFIEIIGIFFAEKYVAKVTLQLFSNLKTIESPAEILEVENAADFVAQPHDLGEAGGDDEEGQEEESHGAEPDQEAEAGDQAQAGKPPLDKVADSGK